MLEHLHRGSVRFDGAPDTWDAVVAREERAIDRAVAERLVSAGELRDWAARVSSLEEPVTVDDVAEAFGVPRFVAYEACRQAS